MGKKIKIPNIPFYFVRHGETDWNKTNQELCSKDNIPLNETGLLQAANVCKHISLLDITKIYSSPLMRAKQTAEIINITCEAPLEFHAGLREILDEKIANTFAEILDPSHTILIVSHGEVYRVLLRILDAQATDLNAENGGLYLFKPSDSGQWVVHALSD